LELNAHSLKHKGTDPHSNSDFRIPTSAFQRVPIIAMTGNATEDNFVESEYPGMNDCIAKPLQRDSLLSFVQKWIYAESVSGSNDIGPDPSSMAAEKPEAKNFPLDLERAIREFMGKTEILFGVLHEFAKTTGIRIDAIHQAVSGLDYGAVASEAHAIKGAAANLTADKLAQCATELEKAVEEQQSERVGGLAILLEQEYYLLEKYIRQICMPTG
jgi:HPt (histidine-containing phosphotransfer) domain-containing protein